MDDFDQQFPHPRYLTVPFIFVPDGNDGGPELAQFKADYPGWVTFRATFTPTSPPMMEPAPQPELGVSEEPGAEPGPWEQQSPDARPRPSHLRQTPRATIPAGGRPTGTHDRSAAPPPVPFPPPVPPPPRPVSDKAKRPDPLQKRGIGFLVNGMTPDELESLLHASKRHVSNHARRTEGVANSGQGVADRSSTGPAGPLTKAHDPHAGATSPARSAGERNAGALQAQTGKESISITDSPDSLANQFVQGVYRLLQPLDPVGAAQAAETVDGNPRESVALPISGRASHADSTGKGTRLAQAVEGEMPVEPPVKPVEGQETNPGRGGLSEAPTPETASPPAAGPPSEVAPVPLPAAPVQAEPEEVRARGDVKGGLPEPEAAPSDPSAASVLDKLYRYTLNPEHPRGKEKAAWFDKALGYTKRNINGLAEQLVFDNSKAVQTEVKPTWNNIQADN